MSSGQHNQVSFPDLDAMLASLIRLMSCYVRDPSASQVMTLLHLMNCLQQHPAYANNIAVTISVTQAQEIWRQQLELIRSGRSCSNHNSSCTKPPGSNNFH